MQYVWGHGCVLMFVAVKWIAHEVTVSVDFRRQKETELHSHSWWNLFPMSDSFIFKSRTTVPWLSIQRAFWTGPDNTCTFCSVWEKVFFCENRHFQASKEQNLSVLIYDTDVWGNFSEPLGKPLFAVRWQNISTLTHRIDTWYCCWTVVVILWCYES